QRVGSSGHAACTRRKRRARPPRALPRALCRMKTSRYTCPCCGYMTHTEPPGSYDICHVGYWEDDPVQLLNPWYEGGGNVPSLVQAQEAYLAFGAIENRFVENVRGAGPSDARDPGWRRVAESDRAFARAPRDLSESEQRDLASLYYWRRHAA